MTPYRSFESTVDHAARIPDITINLKHWRMLHFVVSCGSFSNAAEHLQVSQPAVSYAIAKMEEQLGVPLMRLEGRKAQLTEPGKALLERARFLLREAVELEEFAESLRRGSGPQLRLAVDRNFRTCAILPSLHRFTVNDRIVKVDLFEVDAPEIEELLRSRAVDLAIAQSVPSGLLGDPFIESDDVPVARPDHALFRLGRPLTQSDLDRELRIHVGAPSSGRNSNQRALGTGPRWRVSNFDTAESVLLDGMGYGWLPRHRIEVLLNAGKLRILPWSPQATRRTNFYIVQSRPFAQGSHQRQLADLLMKARSPQVQPQMGKAHTAGGGLRYASPGT